MVARCLLAALLLLMPATLRAAPALPVVATFSVLADMVREVGGDAVAVTMLVPFDGDAHSYEPRPSDLVAVQQARLVVTNGLGMEGWIDRLLRNAGGDAVRVVATEGVVPRRMQEGANALIDPHAWQDPRNGERYAANIEAALARADPDRAMLFHANAARFIAAIRQTDDWIAQQIQTVPEARRKIITSHDAFGYFGARFGVTFLGVQGLSTESEPTPREMAALVQQVRRAHVHTIFIENMTDPRLADTLAQEAGAVLGPTLYSDALSPPDGPAASYLAMFHHNVPLFVAAMVEN